VAWNHKGFGFIRPDDGKGDDLFCHATQISDGRLRRP
jgi:cold shock CspA family protein